MAPTCQMIGHAAGVFEVGETVEGSFEFEWQRFFVDIIVVSIFGGGTIIFCNYFIEK